MLDSFEARVPWRHPLGGESTRKVVIPLDVPRVGRADDWIRFGVHLPPGSERGALVDRRALRIAGANSAPAYRLALSLSFEWHRPGTTRQPVRRSRSIVHWRQVRTASRYPVLSHDAPLAWTYPAGHGVARNAMKRARAALDYLARIGFAETVQDGEHLRVRPVPIGQDGRRSQRETSRLDAAACVSGIECFGVHFETEQPKTTA